MSSGEETFVKEQYVGALTRYSSEYGSVNSHTYTASNIVGPPSRLDDYGDHTSSLVFRTYGRFWNLLPYCRFIQPIGHQPDSFQSTDFIEIEYREAVYPTDLRLFETFCPGGLVRVLISDYETEIPKETKHLSRWRVIWRGGAKIRKHKYDIFSPKLPKHSKRSIATKRLRLEFNDQLSDYYHELDAVQLIGYPWKKGTKASQYLKQRIMKNVKVSVPIKMLENLKIEDKREHTIVHPEKAYFDGLPTEIIRMILSNLEALVDIAQAALTCSSFYGIITEAGFLTELNLKPFYTSLKGDDLIHLSKTYFLHLTKLDLSWTGVDNIITSADAANGVKYLPNLEDLRCRNCEFVSTFFLDAVASCKQLKVLDLFNAPSPFDLCALEPLVKLEYLDISQCHNLTYKNQISRQRTLFKSLSNLKWFLVGRTKSSMFIDESFEQIVQDLTTYCKEIRGVNFWRQCNALTYGVFHDFIEKFGQSLLYFDIGWSHLLQDYGSARFWTDFTGSCPNLEFLALTAIAANISDENFSAFARNCPKLQQLDLLGARGFTVKGIQNLLRGCKDMIFLDLSYTSIDIEDARKLKEEFVNCDIKHVPTMRHVSQSSSTSN